MACVIVTFDMLEICAIPECRNIPIEVLQVLVDVGVVVPKGPQIALEMSHTLQIKVSQDIPP